MRGKGVGGNLPEASEGFVRNAEELQRMALVIQKTRNAVVITGRDGRATWINEAFTEITGYSWEETVGQFPSELLLGPDTDRATVATIEAALQSWQSVTAELLNYRKSGESYWISLTIDPIGTPEEPEGFIAIQTDITERKLLALRLEESERRSRTMLQSLTEVVFERDEIGCWSYLNPAWEELTGYTVEESLGRSTVDFVHPADKARTRETLEALGRGGQARVRERLRYVRKDGEIRWVDSLATLRATGDRQKVAYGTLKDVTETVQTLRDLKGERDFSEALLQTAGSLFIVLDAKGRIVRFNRACEEASGYTYREIVGCDFTVLIPEEDRRELRLAFENLTSGGGAGQIEARWQHRNGSLCLISWSNSTIADEQGQVLHVIGIGQDVTQKRQTEQALRESQERYELCVSGQNDGIWDYSVEDQRAFFSPRWFTMLGYEPGDLEFNMGLFQELLHPDDLPRVDQAMKDYMARRRLSYELEVRARQKDGTYRWILTRGAGLFDQSGKMTRMAGSHSDIHARKVVEHALQKTQDLLLESQRVAKLGSWEVDVESGQLTYTPQTLDVLGREALVERPTFEYFVSRAEPEDQERMVHYYEQAVHEQREADFDMRLRRTDGSRATLRVLVSPVVGPEGKVVRLVGSVQDVTEQRVAARQIATQKAFLRKVIDTSPNFIFVKDANGRFVLANEAVAEVYGTTADNLLGKRDADFCPVKDEIEQFESIDQAVLSQTTDQVAYEESITDSEGKIRWLQTVKRPIVSPESGETQVLGICADITERVHTQHQLEAAREAAMESSRLKSEFLANMSHEIRTPMNGVLGMADLLLDTELKPEQTELARTIRDCGNNLLAILNDILDFSKVEAGKMTLDFAKVDVTEVVEEVASLFAPQAHEKGLTLELAIDWSRPWFMRSDAGRLRQVLSNLVGNALKFTERGSVNLRMGPSPSGGMRIGVRDTGVGIAPDRQSAVFESFVQADGSTTRRFGGTGLGLTIAKQLVELLGGRIGLESEVHRGSEFWIEFPERALLVASPRKSLEGCRAEVRVSDPKLFEVVAGIASRLGVATGAGQAEVIVATADAGVSGNLPWVCIGRRGDPRPEGAHSVVYEPVTTRAIEDAIHRAINPSMEEPELPDTGRHLGREVLLVEDNAVNRAVATRLLEGMGVRVRIATTGLQAVEQTARQKFALVLMDLQMPEMDGLEATALIREQDEWMDRHTPILAMTAHAMAGDRERCIAAGMDDYVSKPIRKEELREKMAKWLPEEPMETNQIDLTYLSEIAGDDLEFQRDVLAAYAEGLPPLLDELKDCVTRGDRDVAYRVAHTLKGSSRSVGADAFARTCEAAETAAKDGDLASATEVVVRHAELVLRECRQFSLAA